MKKLLFVGLILLVCLASCTSVRVQLERVRAENRSSLNKLKVGMDRETVLEIMGTDTKKLTDFLSEERIINNPYRSSMLSVDTMTVEVFYYYTDVKAQDGAISDDELTPIVLINGKVTGWGWDYWIDAARKYEIRIR